MNARHRDSENNPAPALSDDRLRIALSCLDLTSLNDDDTPATIDALCVQADQGTLGHVAAICVYPKFVEQAASSLQGKDIAIATVINFPSGRGMAEDTASATSHAIDKGATEIDIVLDYERFLADAMAHEMVEVLTACRQVCGGNAKMKVILETAALSDDDIIYNASRLAIGCGADFLKTSTGKHASGGASPRAAEIMMNAIKDAGADTGIKISGGVRTAADCAVYFALAERIMGFGWIAPDRFRIGASSLLGELVRHLSDGGRSKGKIIAGNY